MTTFNQDRYMQALHFAAERHLGQKFPGTELPYVIHVSMVATEVVAALAVEAVETPDLSVACALLHDTLEDTETTYDEVDARFGRAVADGVLALTKNTDLEKAEQMPDSLRRLQAQPKEVQLVKLADRITNLAEPPSYWTNEKKTAYRAEAGRILEALGTASTYLATRLQSKIDAYGRFIRPD